MSPLLYEHEEALWPRGREPAGEGSRDPSPARPKAAGRGDAVGAWAVLPLCEDRQGSRGEQGLVGLRRRTTPGLTGLSPAPSGSSWPYPSPNAPSLVTE